MRALAALLLALPAWSQEYTDALEDGRFEQAWGMLEDEANPLLRARGRAEVLYRAGDPAGALRAAREGLALAPDDLELLHRATAATLWLADARGARSRVERLEDALRASALSGENRRAWEDSVASFRRQADDLAAAAETRATAVRRARGFALGVLVAVAVGLALLGRTGPGLSSG